MITMQSYAKIIAVMLVAFGIIACGEKTPQEMRADFDKKMENMFLDGFSGRFSKDELKCAGRAMSSFFSDDELATIYNASWGQLTMADQRMTEANVKFYSINSKMQSKLLIQRALAQCVQ